MGARTLTCIEESTHGDFGVWMANKTLTDGIANVMLEVCIFGEGTGVSDAFLERFRNIRGKYEVRDNIVRMRRMDELESDSRVECDLPTCNSRHDKVRQV